MDLRSTKEAQLASLLDEAKYLKESLELYDKKLLFHAENLLKLSQRNYKQGKAKFESVLGNLLLHLNTQNSYYGRLRELAIVQSKLDTIIATNH